MIVGVEEPDELRVLAFDISSDALDRTVLDRYVGAYVVRLTAVEYTASLETLAIAPGEIPSSAGGAALPGGASRILEALVRGDHVGGGKSATSWATGWRRSR